MDFRRDLFLAGEEALVTPEVADLTIQPALSTAFLRASVVIRYTCREELT